MDLIILNDGMYSLIPVTKEMMASMKLYMSQENLFDLCDILRLKLTTYSDSINSLVLYDCCGHFYGCIWN